jgi:hypothetical protein
MGLNSDEYLRQFNTHLSYLYAFARQMNELDFAISLGGEFRGMQDPGWATTITAHEVFGEITTHFKTPRDRSKAELRVILMLYCQLAEAGGIYETLKNVLGVITLKPYLLWPFKDLVRIKKAPGGVIGPNANATFRDLAITAKAVGLARLSELLEGAFRDDLRNGVSHADYVIWNDGIRLRKRNGGNAELLPFPDVNEALTRGVGFFQILVEHNDASVQSFDPPREIVGRFSANPPMPWTVYFDPKTGGFGIKGSSPGPVTTPKYERQVAINGLLGGKVLACFTAKQTEFAKHIEEHIFAGGFEPNNVKMSEDQLSSLIEEIDKQHLWDERHRHAGIGEVLLASPWGFKWVRSTSDFDNILSKPIVDFQVC